MNQISQKSLYFITPIATGVAAALGTPITALAQEDGARPVIEEITVTATKRGEVNVQDIPSSIQAIPEAMLQEIGALNTEDYTRFMPQVNFANLNSGGDNYVIFRGVHNTQIAFTMTRSSSVYLDEMPLTSTAGTQPDIRMFDVARVEALSGPQGTLFGASAQAGTLRVITNQPNTSQFEANADVQFRNGSDSEESHSFTGMINIPLVEDVFAIRMAATSAKDGGYIDNVLGHYPDGRFGVLFDNSNGGSFDPSVSEYGDRTNSNVVEENWNDTEIFSARVSARWDINDKWATTLAYHYGDTDANGSSAYNPQVGDLQTINFLKNTSRDEWDMWALTIEGDLGFAQLVSATSFYDRQRTWQVDNTLYYRYYMTNYCTDRGAGPKAPEGNNPAYLLPPRNANPLQYYWLFMNNSTDRVIYLGSYCPQPLSGGSPSGDVTKRPDMPGFASGPSWQERFTQEIRLSHQGETIDWLAGLYYDDSNDSWNSVWMASADTPYQESISYQYFVDQTASGSCWVSNFNQIPGVDDSNNATQSCPGAEEAAANATHYWHSWDDTDWEQKAVFGELTWHIGDRSNLTVGARWFDVENTKTYTKWNMGWTDGNDRAVGSFLQPRWHGNELPQSRSVSEFIPKIAFSYNFGDNQDKMAYALYTEGYRYGGVNRLLRDRLEVHICQQ
jgi:outer membrane receptor protein involved in Fe transport